MRTNGLMTIILAAVTLTHPLVTTSVAADSCCETVNVIPMPVSIEHRDSFFVITPSTRLIAENGTATEASKLIDALAPAMDFRLRRASHPEQHSGTIQLRLDGQLSQLGDEGYTLEVSAEQILIRAKQPAGLFYGIQTLLQLLPASIFSKTEVKGINWKVPCVKITD